MVHIEEIDNKGGVRFKINYCVNGERVRESLREIPLVKKGTRQYKEARLLAILPMMLQNCCSVILVV